MKGNCGECNLRWACDIDPDKCNAWPDPVPMTNADRIRAMSDKELARFLASVENRRSADGGGAQWCGMAHALKWLQQPAEEDDHDERKENENV